MKTKIKVRKSKLITLKSVLKDTCWTEEEIIKFSDKPLTVIELIKHPKMKLECLHQIWRHCDKKIIREWNKRVITKITNDKQIIYVVLNRKEISTKYPTNTINVLRNDTINTISDKTRESIVIPEVIKYELMKKLNEKMNPYDFGIFLATEFETIQKTTEDLLKPYYKILKKLLIKAEKTGEIKISS